VGAHVWVFHICIMPFSIGIFCVPQVIVFSFVTIISLMLATTWVTVKLGGVHFNE